MSHEQNGPVSYRQLRELIDRMRQEGMVEAEKIHGEMSRRIDANVEQIVRLRQDLNNHIEQRLEQGQEASLAEASYRLSIETRVSKLETSQYVQIALLAITLIASVVGLFKLFIH